MTRIIAGVARGRVLAVPPGDLTRPTSDRVREALFSRLEHDGLLDGTRVLDLFAGSGALGLEAASRGAAEVVLVEQAPRAVATARRNVQAMGLPGVQVVATSVQRFLAQPPVAGPEARAGPQAARETSETLCVVGSPSPAVGGPAGPAARRFDLVLVDPPYAMTEAALTEVFGALIVGGWLSETATVVAERSARGPVPTWPPGLDCVDERRYGETRLWFAEPSGQSVA